MTNISNDSDQDAEKLALLELALQAAMQLAGNDPLLMESLRSSLDLVRERHEGKGRHEAIQSVVDHDRVGFSLNEIRVVKTPLNIQAGKDQRPRPRSIDSERSELSKAAVRRAKKMRLVLEELSGLGIQKDEIVLYTDTGYGTSIDNGEYVLLSLEALNIEIVVSDWLGNATYVSTSIRGAAFWNSANKHDISNDPNVSVVVYRNESQFRRRFVEVIKLRSSSTVEPSSGNSLDRPREFDLGEVRNCIALHWQNTQEMPAQDSGLVRYGSYANGKTTWKAIGLALYRLNHEAQRARQEPYPTLTDLVREVTSSLGVYDPYVFRGMPLTLRGIHETIEAHYEVSGSLPTVKNQIVEVGPYANTISWSSIDNALRRGHRGLQGGSSLSQEKKKVRKLIVRN